MEQKYTVVFEGQMKQGASIDETVRQLAKAYKKAEEDFKPWFTNSETIIRKEASSAEAEEIRSYFQSLGMTVLIKPFVTTQASDSSTEAGQSSVNIEIDTKNGEPINEREVLESALSQLKSALNNLPDNTVAIMPARLPIRTLAFILDMFFLTIITGFFFQLILIPLGFIDGELIKKFFAEFMQQVDNDAANKLLLSYLQNSEFATTIQKASISSLALFCLYFGILESKWQASLGKHICRIRVYSLKSKAVQLSQSFLRPISFIIGFELATRIALEFGASQFGQTIFVMTLLVALFDKKRLNQTLYDRLTRTCVGNRSL